MISLDTKTWKQKILGSFQNPSVNSRSQALNLCIGLTNIKDLNKVTSLRHHLLSLRPLALKPCYVVLEIKPCGLGSRIRDVEAFWYKREIKIIYFVQLCLIVWFTLTLNFWYLKLKNGLIYFSEDGGWFFLILCYHARHLQQIHWNTNLCRMYGLVLIASVATLNICQILTR